jgi:hypothetical protein
MRKLKARLPRSTRYWLPGLLLLVLLLVALRLALPSILLSYVNTTLDKIPGYDARIADVDVALWRGAYVIYGLEMVKVESGVKTPFVEIPKTDLSIEWKALLQGKMVGEVELQGPKINFVRVKGQLASAPGDGGSDWVEQGKKLFPFDINRLAVHGGSITYREPKATPPIDLRLTQVEAEAFGITNKPRKNDPLPTNFKLSSRVFDTGSLSLDGRAQIFSSPTDFESKTRVEKVDLTKINDFTRHYAAFDFSKGDFSLYSEINARNGQLDGYLKPLFKNVGIVDRRDFENPFEGFWETLVSTVWQIFTNQPKDQFATVIPISGSIGDPDTALLITLGNILKNAFIQAFRPGLENAEHVQKVEMSEKEVKEKIERGRIQQKAEKAQEKSGAEAEKVSGKK